MTGEVHAAASRGRSLPTYNPSGSEAEEAPAEDIRSCMGNPVNGVKSAVHVLAGADPCASSESASRETIRTSGPHHLLGLGFVTSERRGVAHAEHAQVHIRKQGVLKSDWMTRSRTKNSVSVPPPGF